MKLVAEKSCDEHALPSGGRSYISLTLGGTAIMPQPRLEGIPRQTGIGSLKRDG